VVVADAPASLPKPLGCGKSWHDNGGVMTWRFGSATAKGTTTYPSKIDFHQVAAGYGGHFWFTHTIPGTGPAASCTVAKDRSLQVTGTWTPPGVTGSVTIYAAVPNYGAEAPDATYRVVTGTGAKPQYVVINQNVGRDAWIKLGTFKLAAGAHVSLSNADCHNQTGQDIAWDAMQFLPGGSTAPAAR
jgi:hypothetical protein